MRAVWVIVALFSGSCCYGATTVPKDLSVHAHVWPGGGPARYDVTMQDVAAFPHAWDLTLDSAGHGKSIIFSSYVHDGMLDGKHVRRDVAIAAPALAQLVDAINRADFFGLPNEICKEQFEHSGGAYLRVRMNGRTHDVSVCQLAMSRDVSSTRRLEKVWRVLLKAWRSPNQNKELSWFTRRPSGL